MQVFGEWDAPLTEGAESIDVPTDMKCMTCRQNFIEGDNGGIYDSGHATHRECALRVVMGGIGHLVDHDKYCTQWGDPDAGIQTKKSADLVWLMFVKGVIILEKDLEKAREHYGR